MFVKWRYYVVYEPFNKYNLKNEHGNIVDLMRYVVDSRKYKF